MTIEQLKREVEGHRLFINDPKMKWEPAPGQVPVTMNLIDALMRTLEAQARRISELEKRANNNP